MIFGSEGPARAREAYTRLLGQQLRIQGAFEPLLRAAGREGGPLAPVVRPHHFHLDALRADLEALRVPEAWRTPLPATERFAAAIASCAEDADGEGAWRLLGVFYVFEGSTNGGTVIGKRIAEQLGLPADPASALAPAGTRFTNPHGRQVRPRWTAWKEAVDALGLDEPAAEAAVASAREAFERTREVFEDVRLAMGDAAPR